MAKRKKKEKREKAKDPQSKTIKKKRHRWTMWQEAIVPKSVGTKDGKRYSLRKDPPGDKTHYYNKKTREQLKEQCPDSKTKRCCGIYELKAVTEDEEEAVVYVGSTHRKAGRSLYKRLSEYMTERSHIEKIIQRALDRKCQIHVRWLKIREDICRRDSGEELAEQTENEYLQKYDYAWNERLNGNRRKIFGIGVKI